MAEYKGYVYAEERYEDGKSINVRKGDYWRYHLDLTETTTQQKVPISARSTLEELAEGTRRGRMRSSNFSIQNISQEVVECTGGEPCSLVKRPLTNREFYSFVKQLSKDC